MHTPQPNLATNEHPRFFLGEPPQEWFMARNVQRHCDCPHQDFYAWETWRILHCNSSPSYKEAQPLGSRLKGMSRMLGGRVISTWTNQPAVAVEMRHPSKAQPFPRQLNQEQPWWTTSNQYQLRSFGIFWNDQPPTSDNVCIYTLGTQNRNKWGFFILTLFCFCSLARREITINKTTNKCKDLDFRWQFRCQ